MANDPNYKGITKKWLFWIPLALMIISSFPMLSWICYDLTCEAGFVGIAMIFILIIEAIPIFISYKSIKRVTHLICGIIIVLFCVTAFIPLKSIGFFDFYSSEEYFNLVPYVFPLIAGILLIMMSFLKYSGNEKK